MMTAKDLKQRYLAFFKKKDHRILPNVSLIPENDPTTLFISAGMQPLVPYLLGEAHPLGERLVSLQRCLRTGDIDEVGNVSHNTFFEMLGNWSLGDYWKKESLSWSLEFLTKDLELDSKRLHVTIFKGDKNAPKDEASEKIWLSLGISKKRIYPLGKKDNWWEAGKTGPGGPDSEIFYDLGKPACGSNCRPGDGCGRFFEMWNNVFMEYNRKKDGTYEKLKRKNVDTGMGVERTAVILEGKDNIFETSLLAPIIKKIEEISQKKYEGESQKPMRIMADHLRAAIFLVGDGVIPSNLEQGYILRRLIRRAIVNGSQLENSPSILADFLESGNKFEPIIDTVIDCYGGDYPQLKKHSGIIRKEISDEWYRFGVGLRKGYPATVKIMEGSEKTIAGKDAFHLVETYGIPLEAIEQTARKYHKQLHKKGFARAQEEHRRKSRASLDKKFKGGLADHSGRVTKLHTTTHLLHQALRDVLGDHVKQVGSNITPERLRFDFAHPEKLTEKEIKKVEAIINQKIKADLPVRMKMMTVSEAKKRGALALFTEKYGEKIKTYAAGEYSFEVCGGPHVGSTREIGGVKIVKEKAVGAGRRRLYARLVVAR